MISLQVPGSKSWINRFLLLASFADAPSTCYGFNGCTDCLAMVEALRGFGHGIEIHGDQADIVPGRWRPAAINAGDAGSVARFLTPVAGWLGSSSIAMDDALFARPMKEGVLALRSAGAVVDLSNRALTVDRPMADDAFSVTAMETTQFASGFLMLAAGLSASVDLPGAVASPAYLDLTLGMIRDFDIRIRQEGSTWTFKGRARGHDQTAEIDLSGGVALLAALVISGRAGLLKGWNHATVQAEGFLPEELSRSGLDLEFTDDGLVYRPGPFDGLMIDTKSCPDAVPALAVMALKARTASRFENATYLKGKESDRLGALLDYAERTGVDMKLDGETLLVSPGQPSAAELPTLEDHRLVMAGRLIGLMAPGVRLSDTSPLAKSFPDFESKLDQIAAGA